MANTVGELNVEIGAKLDKLEKALHKMDNSIKGAGKKAEKSAGAAFGKVGAAIAGAFSVGAIIEFQKKIIEVGSEFQKFEAVLTTSLGSGSLAEGALSMIQSFAAQTPFSVRELTDAFVKLVNQGFKPTEDEMRKLGDLAASTGKTFDQLAEAIIDAQVGEFERLKEFGVRAQKEGDKVIFTFKGVKTEVDNTSESIQDYILSLGNLEGVSGSMAGISDTLGGSISNLGDSFDLLLVSISETQSFLPKAIGMMSKTLSGFAASIQAGGLLTADEIFFGESAAETTFKQTVARFDALAAKMGGTKKAIEALNDQADKNIKLSREQAEPKMVFYYQQQAAAYKRAVLELTELNKVTDKQVRAQEALITLGKKDIPSILGGDEGGAELKQPIDQQLLDTTEALSLMESQLALAAETGNLFGGTLQSAFEASLINGESFFETFAVGLKNMIAQLIAAAAASAILAGILSTIGLGTTGTFGAIFGGGDSGGGLGGGFGGFFKLLGTDLVASTGRTGGQQGRFN